MSKNPPSKSDEGTCTSWESFCENPHEGKRGLALAKRMVGDPSQAEDVLHDVYLRLLKRKTAVEEEVKPKYFMKSVKNRSSSHLRKRSRSILANAVQIDDGPLTEEGEDSSVQVSAPGLNPEMETERSETNNRYLSIMQSCSENLTEREKALLLNHRRCHTNQEIADAWGEDVKEIRKEMNKVIAKIRYRCRRENKKQLGQ